MLGEARDFARVGAAGTPASPSIGALWRWTTFLLDSPPTASVAFAVFAAVTLVTGMPCQKAWAIWGLVGYLVGAVLLAAMPRSRVPICAILFVTLLCPLLQLSSSWQGQHEIWVVQHATERMLSGTPLYPTDQAVLADVNGYFPYLPGIAVLGAPAEAARALDLPVAFSDVRWTFAAVFLATAVVVTLPANRLDRCVAFWMLASPMATLPLATGGSDLPVVALMLLALVLSTRRRSWQAGLLTGLACAMKLVAWPFALALALMTIARRSRAEAIGFITASTAVVGALVVPFVIASPSGFVIHELAFPADMAPTGSPAATPNVGRLLADTVPQGRWVAIAVVLAAVVVFCARMVIRPPTDERAVAWSTAAALITAAVLLPASRVGYVVYPLAMCLFAVGYGRKARSPFRRVHRISLRPLRTQQPWRARE